MGLDSKLEKYFSRGEVPLEMKVSTLLSYSGLQAGQFVRLGEIVLKLVDSASEAEKLQYKEKIEILCRLMESKRMRLRAP